MVTFSHIPYHEAQARGQRQNDIMNEVMKITDIENKWNSAEVENQILQLLNYT